MRVLPETTVVMDNQSLQLEDLEQEEKDHIMAEVSEQHCDLSYTLATTNPHSLAKQNDQYIAIKINCMDNTANNESVMAIIRALLKAILNKVPSVQIIAPVTSKLLNPITRKQGNIPASSETRIIRGYVQKGALTKDSFHVLLHLQTPQPLDIFGNNKLHKVLSKYPVLSVLQAP